MHKTYDLLNCGPRNRFVVQGATSFIVHNCSYGAGAGKIHQTLTLAGVDVTKKECEEIHADYWQLYSGIKSWEASLVRQWKQNRGWVLNGIGRPQAVDRQYLKDLVNRVCQGSGHDVFILFLLKSAEVFTEQGIEWHAWNVDIHDCFIMEIKEEHVERAAALIKSHILPQWNESLGGLIPLRADPAIVSTWAADKFSEKELAELDIKFGMSMPPEEKKENV